MAEQKCAFQARFPSLDNIIGKWFRQYNHFYKARREQHLGFMSVIFLLVLHFVRVKKYEMSHF